MGFHQPKYAERVQIRLTNETELDGWLYRGPSQRITDLLNDGRLFLPFHDTQETFYSIAKTHIAMVLPSRQKLEPADELPRWIGPRGLPPEDPVEGVATGLPDSEVAGAEVQVDWIGYARSG